MSWSLSLKSGDFSVTGAYLGTATKQQKLVQDLRCAILEQMGTDNLHPSYGSLINGGVTTDGTVYPGVIGEDDIDFAILEIETDITRIIRNYQSSQLVRAKQDKTTYGRATLDPEEVVVDLGGINFNQVQDSLEVTITVITATDTPLTVPLPPIPVV